MIRATKNLHSKLSMNQYFNELVSLFVFVESLECWFSTTITFSFNRVDCLQCRLMRIDTKKVLVHSQLIVYLVNKDLSQ